MMMGWFVLGRSQVSEHGSFWRFGSLKSGRLVERFREGVRRAKRKENQLPVKRGDGVLLNNALSRILLPIMETGGLKEEEAQGRSQGADKKLRVQPRHQNHPGQGRDLVVLNRNRSTLSSHRPDKNEPTRTGLESLGAFVQALF